MSHLVALALACLGLTAPPIHAADTPIIGVTYGNQGWEMSSVHALERWLQRRQDVLVIFTNWETSPHVRNNLFIRQLPAIWDNGNVPLITWEPYTGKSTPRDVVSRIAAGQFDRYVSEWASELGRFLAGPDGRLGTADDRRVYLRLAHEMNGNWYPWGEHAPGEYILMWRRVHRIFENAGLGSRHLQWIWCVTNVDHGRYRAEEYFPGDEWTNWVAIDGYNWGRARPASRWETPEVIYGPMIERVRKLSARPLALTEAGTTNLTAAGASVDAKNAWIAQFFSWVAASGARMVCWFNLDRDADFAVFGGRDGDTSLTDGGARFRAYSGYRQALQAFGTEAAPGSAPRLMSDDRFAGK